MATPFAFEGNLRLPGDHGLPPEPLPFGFSEQFTASAEFVLLLEGAGVQNVNLGTINVPGVKGLLIKVDPSAVASPILVQVNGQADEGIEVAAGGFLALGSPVPVNGITVLTIIFSSTVTVRVWALG